MTAGDIKIRSGVHNRSNFMSGVVMNGDDDYLQINSVGNYEAGANNTKGTISAWVNVPDITNTYCVFSIGLAANVSWYGLLIKAGKPQFYAITNNAVKADVVATTASLKPHTWHHVVVKQDGVRPFLYLDGVLCAMTDTTSTDLTYWGNTLATWDKGAIGIVQTNATEINDFKGGVCYVKYSTGTTSAAVWTDAEILDEYKYRGGMGEGTGKTPNLCTWTLDGTLLDSVTGAGTYTASVVSDVQYDSEYSNLTSNLRLLAPVVADDICFIPQGNGGATTAVVIKAA